MASGGDPELRRPRRTPVKARVGGKRPRPKAELLDADGIPIASVRAQGNWQTRQNAGTTYVTSHEGFSIPQLHALPEFAHVPESTLLLWCGKDQWVSRRKKWAQEQYQRVEAAMGTRLVQSRLKELRALESITSGLDAAGVTTDADGVVRLTLQPKSLESWARVRLDYALELDRLRAQMADAIIPAAAPVQEALGEKRPTVLHPNLRIRPTETEGVAMAMVLMRMRREEVEQKMAERGQEELKRKRPPPIAGVYEAGDGEADEEEA
jgi:hypothetical protein